MGRFERDYNNWKDKGQAKFDSSGWLVKTEPPKIEQTFTVAPTEKVMCPFCLYTAELKVFFVSTKKGISQGNAKCPECLNGMRMKTLLADMDAKAYAEFVFGYRASGFWQKCPFDKWKVRLKAIGWSHPFWTRYKELKCEADVTGMLDISEKQAKEYDDAYAAYEESFK